MLLPCAATQPGQLLTAATAPGTSNQQSISQTIQQLQHDLCAANAVAVNAVAVKVCPVLTFD
jgi:hypothetical protein